MTRILFCLLLVFSAPAPGAAADTRLLGGDTTGATLEWTLPDYRVVAQEAPPYFTIEIDGLSGTGEAGDPRLPATGTLMALPPGTTPVVTVLDSAFDALPGLRIAPVPSLEVPADPATGTPARTRLVESGVYRRDAFFPPSIATIGFTGELRGQPVAQLRLHPVQTNPVTGEVRVYTRIRVAVTFAPVTASPAAGALSKPSAHGAGPHRPVPASPAFREIMRRSIINLSTVGD
ncbi:MAG: hypothetical protein OEY97_08680 [Nitrospirota bacterium]|nr:hypothetical protein [Nitrospirota bacterium]